MNMSAQVFTMPGFNPPVQGGQAPPCPEVVAALEKVLAMAKAGVVQGVGIATVERGGLVATSWSIAVTANSHLMTAAATYLLDDLTRRAQGSASQDSTR